MFVCAWSIVGSCTVALWLVRVCSAELLQQALFSFVLVSLSLGWLYRKVGHV